MPYNGTLDNCVEGPNGNGDCGKNVKVRKPFVVLVRALQVHPTVLNSIAGKCAQNIFANLWKFDDLNPVSGTFTSLKTLM